MRGGGQRRARPRRRAARHPTPRRARRPGLFAPAGGRRSSRRYPAGAVVLGQVSPPAVPRIPGRRWETRRSSSEPDGAPGASTCCGTCTFTHRRAVRPTLSRHLSGGGHEWKSISACARESSVAASSFGRTLTIRKHAGGVDGGIRDVRGSVRRKRPGRLEPQLRRASDAAGAAARPGGRLAGRRGGPAEPQRSRPRLRPDAPPAPDAGVLGGHRPPALHGAAGRPRRRLGRDPHRLRSVPPPRGRPRRLPGPAQPPGVAGEVPPRHRARRRPARRTGRERSAVRDRAEGSRRGDAARPAGEGRRPRGQGLRRVLLHHPVRVPQSPDRL